MKAALLTGIKIFTIREVPNPTITQDTDVLIRLKTVGVCGSDVHYYTSGRIGSQVVQFPFIIGHEAAGVVEQTGKRTVRVHPGTRIAIDPAVSCGTCDQCKSGREHTCRSLQFLGCPTQLDGSLAEYLVLPEQCCYPIPASMPYEQATLSEPLAIGIYAVKRAGVPDHASIGILGAGPIGMSIFHILRTRNVGHVFLTDKIVERLERARILSPSWTGNPDESDIVKEIASREPQGLDVVFECSGDPEAISQGIPVLKPGGRLVIVGIPEVDEISLPIHELRRKEITILNIRRQVRCTQKAIDLLASGQVNMDSMVTHRFTLEETQKAFELVANYRDGVMKAMITMD